MAHAVVWRSGTMTVLLDGEGCSTARAIDDEGTIVGDACAPSGEVHPVRFEGGGVVDLGTLGGSSGTAVAVSASGRIVGFASTPDGFDHGWLFDGARMLDAGTLPGGPASALWAIASDGTAVGYSMTVTGEDHAVVMFRPGELLDLNDLVDDPSWTLREAVGIDDAGRIAANAYRGPMAKPVPGTSLLPVLLVPSR